MKTKLRAVIAVDKDKCVSCHACLAACPVKMCNDMSGDYAAVDADRCIGCGSCIAACTHEARCGIDEFPEFMDALARGIRPVAIVAPGAAANFPGLVPNLNGWLRSMGVAACFDVSFGAELTVKSYVESIKADKPATVIAQPCPAIVSYIQIYRPELAPHLAKADSPMTHTMKMIREFRPEFRDAPIAVISPCYAKRREFDETGYGDFNVTMKSLAAHFADRGIDLASYPAVGFEGSPAERAVLFSTPGGLLETAKREVPGIERSSRKIEGKETVYPYLDGLHAAIEAGIQPLLVDCLNCDRGCNAGAGTPCADEHADVIESRVEARRQEAERGWRKRLFGRAKLRKAIDAAWRPGLYARSYRDLSENGGFRVPSRRELADLFRSMGKTSMRDVLNCCGCGYNSCELMAAAIWNGLNRKENCSFYKERMIEELAKQKREERADIFGRTRSTLDKAVSSVVGMLDGFEIEMEELRRATEETNERLGALSGIASTITEISRQTDLLALNASIEAARAGEAGRGFAVVAESVKSLAGRSREESESIAPYVKQIDERFESMTARIEKLASQSAAMKKEVGDKLNAVNDYLERGLLEDDSVSGERDS